MKHNTCSFYLYLLCFLVFSGNIYLLVSYKKTAKQHNLCIAEQKKTKLDRKRIRKNLIEREYKQVASTGLFITDTLLVESNDHIQYPLLDLVKEPFSIIFYFNKSHCQSCVETELSRIKKHLDDINEYVLILSSGMLNRDVEYIQKSMHLEFGAYRLNPTNLRLPIVNNNMPGVFLLTPEGLVFSAFIPNINESVFSEQYYLHVKNVILDSILCSK